MNTANMGRRKVSPLNNYSHTFVFRDDYPLPDVNLIKMHVRYSGVILAGITPAISVDGARVTVTYTTEMLGKMPLLVQHYLLLDGAYFIEGEIELDVNRAHQETSETHVTVTEGDVTVIEVMGMNLVTAQVGIATQKAAEATQGAATATEKAEQTAADAVQTAADRLQTGLDATTASNGANTATTKAGEAAGSATAAANAQAGAEADRTQTGLDRTATAADRVQTGLDKTATAADRAQTGLDTTATADDRVQTAADRAQTGLDVIAANSARDAALIQSGVYATEAAGRAAVADGQAFKVQGSGDVAAYEYRRTNSSTSVLIATYPSLQAAQSGLTALSKVTAVEGVLYKTETVGATNFTNNNSISLLWRFGVNQQKNISLNGILKSLKVTIVGAGGNIRLAVLRKNVAQGKYLEQSRNSIVVSVGLNTLDISASNIQVIAGDVIALQVIETGVSIGTIAPGTGVGLATMAGSSTLIELPISSVDVATGNAIACFSVDVQEGVYLKVADKSVSVPVLHTGVNDLKQFSVLGAVEPSTDYDLKDYVPVDPNRDYELFQPAAPYGQRICFFDAAKNPLGRFNQAGGGAITLPSQKFKTPANCAFIGLYHRQITGNQVFNYVLKPLDGLYIESAGGGYSFPISSTQIKVDEIKPAYLRIVNKSVSIPVLHTGVNDLKQINASGAVEASTTLDLKDYIPVSPNTDYILTQPTSPYGQRLAFFDADKNPLGRFNNEGGGYTAPVQNFRTPFNCAFILVYHRTIAGNQVYNYTLKTPDDFYIENESGSYSYSVKNLTQDIDLPADILEQIEDATSKAEGAQGALLAQQNQIDTLSDEISAFPPNPVTPYYLARPSSGRVNFSVPVNCNIPDVVSETLLKQDDTVIHYDWGLLFLPTNYTQAGKPVRLIISCHGSGIWIGPSSTVISGDFAFLLSQGYAIMDMNGIPATFAGTTPDVDNNARHYGAPFALQSYLKGYEYVVNNYNVAKDGCFVLGTSMGGMSSFMLVNSGSIPVLAQGAFCPVVDLFKQAYVNPWNAAAQRAAIASHFGFTGTAPTFTSTVPPTQPEIDYFIANISKIIGYDNMLKRTTNADYASMYSVIPASNLVESATEQTEYNKYAKIHPVPLKIWHCKDDTTVRWRYSKYIVEMIKRAGGLAILRTFVTGGHPAWDTGETITGIPTIDGGTTSTKACTYELVLWFKRFN